jgi:hypothetical protein
MLAAASSSPLDDKVNDAEIPSAGAISPVAASAMPEFLYAHLPFFRPDHRRVTFAVDRSGALTGVSTRDRMYVSGGGGGGSVYTDSHGHVHGSSAPVWVNTTYETTMELWILDAEGRESSVRIRKDIPLKEGHRVTVMNACVDGGPVHLCLILNHTAREMHFLRRSLAVVQLSPMERLCILGAFAGLLIICVLLGLADGALGACVGIVVGVSWIFFILWRGAFLRERFAQHCEYVAGLHL